jgi:hypothetical protein
MNIAKKQSRREAHLPGVFFSRMATIRIDNISQQFN